MKALLKDVWQRDKRSFLVIMLLNVAVSLTGGVSILMLIPMLSLLDIPDGSGYVTAALSSALRVLPYEARVATLIGVYMALIVCKALLTRQLTLRENAYLEDYSFALRGKLYRTVTRADWEKLTHGKKTDTINLFTAQCGQVSYAAAEIIHFLSSVVSAVIQLLIALWLSVPVTLLVVAAGGAFVTVFRSLLKKSKAYGEELIAVNRAMHAELYHQLSGVKEVRAYGVQKAHDDLFGEISETFRQAKMRYVRLRTTPQLVSSVATAGMISLVFVACVLLFRMETARLMVLVYVFVRLWPVFSSLYNYLQSIQTCVPAYEKLCETFETLKDGGETETKDAPPLPFERRIVFDNVSFTYASAEETVLKNVSFTLEKGTITALVGRSGAGKTTLADLLMGFLHPSQGRILIDDTALTPENLSAWRQSIGYIPQEPLILSASVRENLLRFHPLATEKDMMDALTAAQAWGFVEKLENGLDTLLGDQGVRLSGGERQRIVLARALLGKPRLLVMDEATSAMDYESENAVRTAIQSLRADTTVLIIAHRLATVRTAEYAVVLENGAVTETGPMSALLRRDGGYLHGLVSVD